VVIDFSRRRYQCVDRSDDSQCRRAQAALRSDDSQCRRAAQAASRSASANDEDDEVIGPSIARDDGQGDDQGDDDDDDDDQGDGQGDDEDDDEDADDPNECDRVEFITVPPREDRGPRRMNRAVVIESMELEQSVREDLHEHVTKLKRKLAEVERLQIEVFNEIRGCKMHRCTVCHE